MGRGTWRGTTASPPKPMLDSPGLNIAEVGNAPEEGATHPGAPELADHILNSLREDNFDIAQSDTTPKGSIRGGIPHAYGFLYHSILSDNPPPSGTVDRTSASKPRSGSPDARQPARTPFG